MKTVLKTERSRLKVYSIRVKSKDLLDAAIHDAFIRNVLPGLANISRLNIGWVIMVSDWLESQLYLARRYEWVVFF